MTSDNASMVKDQVERLETVRQQVALVIVGQQQVMEEIVIAVICKGHVLLEGLPGMGKTMLVRTLGKVLDLSFGRIQFTPDLMPADVVGTDIIRDFDGKREFVFEPGPIFTNLLLADEINRATPKTQSALLEAMQEGSVTSGGETRILPEPFLVMATQNPIEMEGTYPLPEAQLDRFFFHIKVPAPDSQELKEIARRTTGYQTTEPKMVLSKKALLEFNLLVRQVPLAETVLDYAVRLALATRPESQGSPPLVKENLRYGASPRGLQAMILAAKARALIYGRYNVSYEDLRSVIIPALSHRILLNFKGETQGISAVEILNQVTNSVKEQA